MKNKEIFFFIAKSLTILSVEKNRLEIEAILSNDNVDWEKFVKISTSHLVLPAIYINFKISEYLKYLPNDLVQYMKNITEINRERNKLIIDQAKEINKLLLMHNIKPIFLKGMAALIEGIYNDIGERMISDIDLIVSEKNFLRAVKILKDHNYKIEKNQVIHHYDFRHYSRLIKNNKIAAVEVHKDLTIENYRHEFNYEKQSFDAMEINNFLLLNYNNQLFHSIISEYINDYGYELKRFSLRNAYDVFLLSKKVNFADYISRFDKLRIPFNCFIAKCNLFFGDIESLKYENSEKVEKYIKSFKPSNFQKKFKIQTFLKLALINFKRKSILLYRSLIYNRRWLVMRIKSKFF